MAKPLKFKGVDEELQKILDANMDEAPARRRAREAFKHIQLGLDHILFKTPLDGLKMKEACSLELVTNGLFAVLRIAVMEPNQLLTLLAGIARKLASCGYGVFAMDYPGFGLSEGLHGYIHRFDWLVDDVIEQYTKIKENPEFQTLPCYLFGESLGGAVALKMHLKQPNAWSGACLVAPMCKIADDMVPPWILKQILIGVANILPKQKLVPQKDLAEAAFRDIKKRELTPYNVIAYKDKPRLRTALEMLRTTAEIEQNLEKVSLPILILHGENDIVTDPAVSKALYEKASSSDKNIILYKDAGHSLLEGEPDDMINRVFSDIISWLDEHSSNTAG
ncbi:hypothetical protein GOBAR_DD19878 [Gossypium barbadense]|nr:hypothetical protein GOBAR_DD19878 [Gossypium barbadense]